MRITLADERAGEVAGLIQEAILIQVFWSVDAGIVEGNVFAKLPANQVEDRLACILAEQIPKGDVEGGNRPHFGARIAKKIGGGKQVLPMALAIKNGFPEQHGRREIMDDRLYGSGYIKGFAGSFEAVGSKNMHPEEVGMLRETQGLNADNLHAGLKLTGLMEGGENCGNNVFRGQPIFRMQVG